MFLSWITQFAENKTLAKRRISNDETRTSTERRLYDYITGKQETFELCIQLSKNKTLKGTNANVFLNYWKKVSRHSKFLRWRDSREDKL